MAFKSTGTVRHIGETKSFGASGFTKRELVIEIADNPKYPQTVAFECTKDRCALLDSVRVGDTIDVHWNLNGREWRSPSGEVKYFNTLTVWKLDVGRRDAAGGFDSSGDSQDKIPFASCDVAHEPNPIAKVLR